MKWLRYDGFRMGGHWGFWFEVFGVGLAVSTMKPCFSERMGLSPYWTIGRFKITTIRRAPR